MITRREGCQDLEGGGLFWMWGVGSRLVSSEGERLESRVERIIGK